jgi:hypothetical protein
MISSGLNVPTPAILIPALAVPYAAPMAIVSPSDIRTEYMRISSTHQQLLRQEKGDIPPQRHHQIQ